LGFGSVVQRVARPSTVNIKVKQETIQKLSEPYHSATKCNITVTSKNHYLHYSIRIIISRQIYNYKKIEITSTKCQYQSAASSPKW